MPSSKPAVNQATKALNTYLELIRLGQKTVADLNTLLTTPIPGGDWAQAINNDLWGIESDARLNGLPMVQALINEAQAAEILPILVRHGGDVSWPGHHGVARVTMRDADKLVSVTKLLGAIGGPEAVESLLDVGMSSFTGLGVESGTVIESVRFWWDMLLAGRDNSKLKATYQVLHAAAMRERGIAASFADPAAQLITGVRWRNRDPGGRLQFNYYLGPSSLCSGDATWSGAIAGTFLPAQSTLEPIKTAIANMARWFPAQRHQVVTDPSQANVFIYRADTYNPKAPANQQNTMSINFVYKGKDIAVSCVAIDLYGVAINARMPVSCINKIVHQ